MKIVLSPQAEKQLKKIPKIDQIAIAEKIRRMRDETVVTEFEKLKDFANIFRARVGNYHIVFRKTSGEIYIILIRHRKDVYRLLSQLLR